MNVWGNIKIQQTQHTHRGYSGQEHIVTLLLLETNTFKFPSAGLLASNTPFFAITLQIVQIVFSTSAISLSVSHTI